MFVDTGDCNWKDIKLSILNVAVGEGTFQVGLSQENFLKNFFFIIKWSRESHGDQPDVLICFSLETVNFELLTLYQTAVHQEPADVLPLIPLQKKNHQIFHF